MLGYVLRTRCANVPQPNLRTLMAADEKYLSPVITTIPPLRTANETSTRHSGVPNQIHASTNQAIIDMRAREVSFDENSIIESSHLNFPEIDQIWH